MARGAEGRGHRAAPQKGKESERVARRERLQPTCVETSMAGEAVMAGLRLRGRLHTHTSSACYQTSQSDIRLLEMRAQASQENKKEVMKKNRELKESIPTTQAPDKTQAFPQFPAALCGI